jgi:hypothetical protein
MLSTLMTELQKEIVKYGAVAVLLSIAVYYQTDQLKAQKTELRQEIGALSDRLNHCEKDRLTLSVRVAQLEASLNNFSPLPQRSKKQK